MPTPSLARKRVPGWADPCVCLPSPRFSFLCPGTWTCSTSGAVDRRRRRAYTIGRAAGQREGESRSVPQVALTCLSGEDDTRVALVESARIRADNRTQRAATVSSRPTTASDCPPTAEAGGNTGLRRAEQGHGSTRIREKIFFLSVSIRALVPRTKSAVYPGSLCTEGIRPWGDAQVLETWSGGVRGATEALRTREIPVSGCATLDRRPYSDAIAPLLPVVAFMVRTNT